MPNLKNIQATVTPFWTVIPGDCHMPRDYIDLHDEEIRRFYDPKEAVEWAQRSIASEEHRRLVVLHCIPAYYVGDMPAQIPVVELNPSLLPEK